MHLVALTWALAISVEAFYLPGVAPRDYEEGEDVSLKVNKLDSVKTQLPYDYYSLPFCRPDSITTAAENLGEHLSGELIKNSPYSIAMRISENCKLVCAKEYNKRQLKAFRDRIDEDYRINWIIDNMPATTKFYTEATGSDGKKSYVPQYEKGFALGFVGSEELPKTQAGIRYINNHIRLKIFYHEDAASFTGSRIVGFEVKPFSIKHELGAESKNWNISKGSPHLVTCPTNEEQSVTKLLSYAPLPVNGYGPDVKPVFFWTYDVHWEASPIKWASRWDVYLKMTDSEIHWFSIFNSITIVLFLSSMTAFIMVRTLHRDLVQYNEVDLSDDQIHEEKGWKLVHGDVFRPPQNWQYFAVLLGTGTQIFAMTLITLTFALLGFLSPANRGGLLTAVVILFVFMGALAGYNSTRIYKMFGEISKAPEIDWKRNTLRTAFLFPSLLFCLFFSLNLIVWGEKSSGAVPFSTLLSLLLLWVCVSVPLTYVGAYIAFKKPAYKPPVKVTEIARQSMLEATCYTQPIVAILIGGVLPFGAVFIEIFFIMSSVWLHQFYYVFGFLYIVFIILIIVCAEISIVMCYFQLCNEDYHWWWRSFCTSGASGIYLFLYSILYYFTRLDITSLASTVLFFGYMLLASLLFSVLTGTIGHYACFLFVDKIYSSVKID
eukprot:gb/GEZN01003090.1/.p1 GENE.gb/GEZN01003090.1/~~gb/GEZN01003090.1/.p1  ORF type:complete len:661 (-),score=103.75 gb/GEZN01003090.1/:257-2239(-)